MADASKASLGVPPHQSLPPTLHGVEMLAGHSWSPLCLGQLRPAAVVCVCVSSLRIPWDFVDGCRGPVRFQFSGLG